MDHFATLAQAIEKGLIPHDLGQIIYDFYISYGEAVTENSHEIKALSPTLNLFLSLVIEQLQHPYPFEPFHQRITKPVNLYRFGLDLVRPLIVFPQSTLLGIEHVDAMQNSLARGENVILFGNHQTEPDPQAISLMLEKTHPRFAEEMIFVAGHRVISDPLAVPVSKGCNLLCIFSKRYIESPPEQKEEKLLHNQRTMKKMSQLLTEGGRCIYVAPSGGRDRPNQQGTIAVAPFDPQSIEMFWLMAKQSGRVTHFHPLSLATYNLLPPPSSIQKELGEKRQAKCTPVHLAFGPEINMENFPGSSFLDKKQKKKIRAEYIWKLVSADYNKLVGNS